MKTVDQAKIDLAAELAAAGFTVNQDRYELAFDVEVATRKGNVDLAYRVCSGRIASRKRSPGG